MVIHLDDISRSRDRFQDGLNFIRVISFIFLGGGHFGKKRGGTLANRPFIFSANKATLELVDRKYAESTFFATLSFVFSLFVGPKRHFLNFFNVVLEVFRHCFHP